MTTRTISQIESATNERVGPFKIKNVLPTRNLKQVDPFLLIHHMQPFQLKPGDEARIPPHPHAGFEVVTYLLDGEFFHRDSKGFDQVATGGDVNWMTSGSGIVHSEGPTESFLLKGGTVQLLQVWINLPAAQKQLSSAFRHYSSDKMPVIENDNWWLKVVIGGYSDKTSPISTYTPMFLYHIKVKKGVTNTLPVKDSFTAAIYTMQGKLKVLNKEVSTGDLVDFHLDGNQIAFTATEDAELILFGGEPIKEKVVSYGPFVMNSMEEIQQAIHQYESGKMGVLEY
jgi:quercetin 2,3-dioxygenase